MKWNLNKGKCTVLVNVKDGDSFSEIARKCDFCFSGARNIILSLIDRGLLNRVPGINARSVGIELTEKGEQVKDYLRKIVKLI